MRTFSKSRLRGFTLVELMIVVAIIGILAALAIYGVSRYMRNAKTAEARSALGAMAKGNISAYNNEKGGVLTLKPGSASGSSNMICAGASVPVPGSVPQGTKYQSKDSEWSVDKGGGIIVPFGFACLKFSMDQPQYFMYTYAGDATTGIFTATANGDLNGDKTTSEFALAGATESGRVVLAPSIKETAPDE